MRLVLASASPQRRAILEQLGLRFEVRRPDVDEVEDGPPAEVAAENARRKATAARPTEVETVVGCDTVVAAGGRLFGKPSDEAEARAGLAALAGGEHEVVSGLSVVEDGRERSGTATTRVRFRALGPELVEWYLATGEWRGRAGGYAIQGRGAALVAGLEGDYLNVVGLPVALLLDLVPNLLGRGPAASG